MWTGFGRYLHGENLFFMSEKEIQKVAAIFQNLGAAKEKAETMASQLIKRAEQLAKQNDSSKLSELQTLLETAICGAQGTLKPDKKGVSE